MTLPAKPLTEAAGTFVFFAVIAVSGHAGSPAPLAIGGAPGIHPGAGVYWYSALAAEFVFTTALVLVVLNIAATKQTAGNSFTAWPSAPSWRPAH